ncbi:MAG: hypothetical protein HC934_01910 [Acaryochloridaceae cyanobacterium SU_2_1]|nr:hypothetical protein [Acaryochloridaceae cyanobacterium SU_2_1]
MRNLTLKQLGLGCLPWISLTGLYLGTATIVKALPAQEVTTTYFSDSSKTEAVGERILLCNGQRATWGRVTRYAVRSSEPCNGGGPTPPGPGPLPCEFLEAGCSPIPNRQDGHFWQ